MFMKAGNSKVVEMFHSFALALIVLLFFNLQLVELLQGSPSHHQNVITSSTNTNQANPAASVRQIQFHHHLLKPPPPSSMQEGRKRLVATRAKRENIGIYGTPVTPHEFPHHVYLSRGYSYSLFCGGSIISKRLILTSAHCVDGGDASSMRVTAGAHDRESPSGLAQVVDVDEIHVHPNYRRNKHEYNIAILVLSKSLQFSAGVRSVRLPDRDAIFSGNATVVGWGHAVWYPVRTSVLRKLIIPIVSKSQCHSQYANSTKFNLTERMFCAGEKGEELISCQGDSGGGALCEDRCWAWSRTGFPVICGIVSSLGGCGLAGYPGAFAEVSKYIGWILGALTNEILPKHCNIANQTSASVGEYTRCVAKYLPPEAEAEEAPYCGDEQKEPAFLLVSNVNSILKIDLNQPEIAESLPLGQLGNVKAVEFDLKTNSVFWVDVKESSIKRLVLDGKSRPETLVSSSSSDLTHVGGLAFDWMSANLYFADYSGSKIEVVRTDGVGSALPGGRMRKTLLTKPHLDHPWGLAVHPGKGYIFWTDWSPENPFIGRAHLDGSHASRITKSNANFGGNIKRPTGLTLDLSEDRIYWVDEALGRMMTSGLDGRDLKIVLDGGGGGGGGDVRISSPFAVGIYKNTVYWADWNTHALYKARIPKDNKPMSPNSIVKIRGGLSSYSAFKVYGVGSQQGQNICTSSKCNYLCMMSRNRGVACLCPDGFTKQNDTCI